MQALSISLLNSLLAYIILGYTSIAIEAVNCAEGEEVLYQDTVCLSISPCTLMSWSVC